MNIVDLTNPNDPGMWYPREEQELEYELSMSKVFHIQQRWFLV